MKAVILAAGRGIRIPEITREKPKCLIKIGEKMKKAYEKWEEDRRNGHDYALFFCLTLGWLS